MKQFIRKLFGINKILAEKEALQDARDKAVAEAVRAQEKEELSKLSEKDRATRKKEPWVGVINTHVNTDNVRNGFFELDWNEYFVLQLKEAGYKGDTEEAVVDQWFQELCRGVGSESGVDMDRRGSGFINVNNLGDGKSEVF